MKCPRCRGTLLGDTCINCGYQEIEVSNLVYNVQTVGNIQRWEEYPPGVEYPGIIKRRTKGQMING